MKKTLLVLSTLGIVSGCGTLQPQPLPKPLPLVAQKQTVNVPPDLLVDCSELTSLDPTKPYSQGQSVDIISTWSSEHLDCSSRFTKVRNLLAQALNINIDVHGNIITVTPSSPVSK